MIRSTMFSMVVVVLVALGAGPADAQSTAERGSIAEAAVRLAANATQLARNANGSDDRAVRRKFAPRATELGDDLAALARRARKDVPLEAIEKDALAISRDAAELVELADEAEEKDERKSLRAQAQVLEQGVRAMRKHVETLAARTDTAKQPARPAAISADSFQQLVAAIKDADFDRGKAAVVQGAARNNYFTSAQVATVISLFDYDDGRVEGAVAMWSKIVDPQNTFVIYAKFDFEGGKQKLRRRVGG